MLLIK